MARARLNPLFASISGKIGEISVAERQGKFFVRKLRTRTTPQSPKELERRGCSGKAQTFTGGPVPVRDTQQRNYSCLSGSIECQNNT